MKKVLISVLIASLPGIAMADSTQEQIAALKAQLAAMQSQLATLQQSVQAQQDALSPDEAATMKQQVTNQQMKVDALQTAATEGPLAGLSVTGYLDPTYMYNRNANSSSFMFANHVGSYNYDNSTIGDVYLDIKKTFGVGPTAPSAEITIMPNRGNGETLLTNNNGTTGNNIINTAVINFPLSDSTALMAGLMPSFGGYEVQQSNQMETLTHNLMYDFSDPGSYVGVGASWSVGNWATKLLIGNEQNHTSGYTATNGSGTQSNRSPTVTGRFDYTWSSAIDLGGSFNVGRQTLPASVAGPGFGYQGTSNSAFSQYAFTELDYTYNLDDVIVNAEADYGQQKDAAFNGGNAAWYGASLLAHEKWNTEMLGRMGATLRYDYLNDSRNGGGGGGIVLGATGQDSYNGFGIDPNCANGAQCKGANHQSLTADLLFYPTNQLILKFEMRHDWTNQNVFLRSDGNYTDNNNIIGAQAVYSF
jgi:hypothetical protein